MAKELPIPPPADTESDAVEIVRMFIRGKAQGHGLVVGLAPQAFDDHRVWGILMADFARHIADAMVKMKGMTAETVINDIRDMMDAELANQTSPTHGTLERTQ